MALARARRAQRRLALDLPPALLRDLRPVRDVAPCRTQAEAKFFRDVIKQMGGLRRERMPIEIIGAWRNLLVRMGPAGGNALPYGAGFHLYQLSERAIPYSAALAIARAALTDDSLRKYERIMAGYGVVRAISGEHQPEILRLFGAWFAPRENEIAAAAARETARLDAARKRLSTIRQCAEGERIIGR